MSVPPRGSPLRRRKSPKFLSGNTSQPTDDSSNPIQATFSDKSVSSFTTCLSIPVQGTQPIAPDGKLSTNSTAESSDITPQAHSNLSKRAPRKSKTDALAAMRNRERSSSVDSDDDNFTGAGFNQKKPIPVSPTLDLKSVKTTSPRSVNAPEPRPFDLTHCPIYYPTAEEFKDPTAYVKSISAEAKEYGICKIVPPEEWKMPFVTKTESFRFKTRLQRLNSIEASSRAKLNFLEQLYQFHRQQGNPRVAVPTINHKPLDLWLLRKEVQKLGGYHAVTKGRKWSDLGRILGYTGIPGLSAQIKNSYTRVILPYEDFCQRSRTNAGSSSQQNGSTVTIKPESSVSDKGPSAGGEGFGGADGGSEPSSPLTNSSSPLSEVPEDAEMRDNDNSASAKLRRSNRMGSAERTFSATPKKPASVIKLNSPVIPRPVFHDKREKGEREPQYTCEICQKANHEKSMLLCDGCDCGYHMFCLNPPLDAIPKEEWYCYTCIAGTGVDFGFDEGEEHTLSSFQARDREFRRMWFENHPPPSYPSKDKDPTVTKIGKVDVSEYDVENEFWRLVQSPNETVEIEYGADVHSTTHGSAMPTMETHPTDPYSKDSWNLNNIPIVPDSLLRFIKSDISGMTVPWTYVGMTFSTFCWHNEDHYTYSINFMHWGETKTWYGIPGKDAERFEAAIKYEAPDLFEVQPDLLFQLVTLMNPKRVSDAGVRVYACNQRAGEFVITFPKAYHAGFNHGLNFNEAVNFALPDWLPLGRDCAVRYAEHRKMPVFSHDELLITITQHSQSIKTAIWLLDPLREMVEREKKAREKARSLGYTEGYRGADLPEDQYQCTVCKVFCYLSQITCQCATKAVCIDHGDLLCDKHRRPEDLILRKRFTDEELTEILFKVKERAEVPPLWTAKLTKLLQDSGKPHLRSLRALLAEGDRISHPLPGLANLRKCVTHANEWIENANVFLVRKHSSRKRQRRPKGKPSPLDSPAAGGRAVEDTFERPEKGLPDLYALLKDVEALGFDSPEIVALQTLAQQAEDAKAKAIALLEKSKQTADRAAFVKECEMLVIEASSINVFVEELVEVDKVVQREQLMTELEDVTRDTPLTPEEVRQLVSKARACDLPSEAMKVLLDKEKTSEEFEKRASHILTQYPKSLEDLETFVNMEGEAVVDTGTMNRVKAIRARGLEIEKQAKLWLGAAAGSNDTPKPTVMEVMKLVTRAEKEFNIPSVVDLKATAEIALELESRCDQVMKGRYTETGDTFRHIEKWAKYAEEHLQTFQLPNFEKLQWQVEKHNQWLANVPWWCNGHKACHADPILNDVFEATRTDDDVPPTDEYVTCICLKPVRPPPPGEASDAVQCDHCMARFHGTCAATKGSCPFCDYQHWDGTVTPARDWHFCFLPPMLVNAPEITKRYSEDWRNLEIIVHRVDRLSAVVGQFLSFASQAGNQRAEYIPQVRHYMRKLYKIQFAVSPVREVSFGLDLAALHRVLAGQPVPTRTRKRRRPRFTFGQDLDVDWLDNTRCTCRGRVATIRGFPTVKCEGCNRLYHTGCVFYFPETNSTDRSFLCPLCCLRKGKKFKYSDVRVIPPNDGAQATNICIDTYEMLETFSKDIVYKQLPVPFTKTLYVDLVRFVPGQPDTSVVPLPSAAPSPPLIANGVPASAPPAQKGVRRSPELPPIVNARSRSNSTTVGTSAGPSTNGATRGLHEDSLPSWSRWNNGNGAARSTSRRSPPDSTSSITPPPPAPSISAPPSRKRKFSDDILSDYEPSMVGNGNGISSPSLKRRTTATNGHDELDPQGASHTVPQSPARSINGSSASAHSPAGSTHTQTLSPSLRMIVSPSNHPMTLPRIEPHSPQRRRANSTIVIDLTRS